MITVKDCEAYCDANPNWVHELACRECLTMMQAYARAHEATVCANVMAMPSHRPSVAGASSDHRLAA